MPERFRGPEREKGLEPVKTALMDIDNPSAEVERLLDNPGAWMDYEGGDIEAMTKEGYKHAGIYTYVISPLSERTMFSNSYANCTGVVAFCKDKTTGKNLAFASHQNPEFFLNEESGNAEKFTNDLAASLAELKERAEENSIDVRLMGGNYDLEDPSSKYSTDYHNSIKKLGEIVQNTLGVDPIVIAGPAAALRQTDLVVNPKKRKAWVLRPKEEARAMDKPFAASELEEREKSWKVEE